MIRGKAFLHDVGKGWQCSAHWTLATWQFWFKKCTITDFAKNNPVNYLMIHECVKQIHDKLLNYKWIFQTIYKFLNSSNKFKIFNNYQMGRNISRSDISMYGFIFKNVYNFSCFLVLFIVWFVLRNADLKQTFGHKDSF